MRVLALAFISYVLASFAWELTLFEALAPPSDSAVRRTSAAIVFTGQFARIDAALKLLGEHRVRRVFISGVNGGAGLSKKTFVAQFSRRNPELVSLEKLVDCCVEMGEAAENTVQNALETRCWLQGQTVSGSLLLITGRTHMARAFVLLSRAAPGREIVPFPVEYGVTLSSRSDEYLKFVKTLVLTWLPGFTRLARFSGAFAEGCPTELKNFAPFASANATK